MSRGFNIRWVWRARQLWVSSGLLTLLWSGAVGADYQAGLDAYQRGDPTTALKEWRAVVGKPATFDTLAIYRESLYAIGMLHWQGEGVPQDYAVATVWLKQAADINHPGAQVKLGYLYSTGRGVPQNFAEAARYFRLAARQGDADAQHNLAVLQREGLLRRGGDGDGAALLPGPEFGPEAGAGFGPQIGPEPGLEAGSAGSDRRTDSLSDLSSDALGAPTMASPHDAGAGSDLRADPAPDAIPDASDASGSPVTTAARVPSGVPDPIADAAGGREWILAQDPSHYTIQVIALRRPERLNEFAAAHADWAPFAIYPVPGNTLPLWVMVQGVYPDRAAAGEAARTFPAGIQQRDQLWIRPFKRIQDKLR